MSHQNLWDIWRQYRDTAPERQRMLRDSFLAEVTAGGYHGAMSRLATKQRMPYQTIVSALKALPEWRTIREHYKEAPQEGFLRRTTAGNYCARLPRQKGGGVLRVNYCENPELDPWWRMHWPDGTFDDVPTIRAARSILTRALSPSGKCSGKWKPKTEEATACR